MAHANHLWGSRGASTNHGDGRLAAEEANGAWRIEPSSRALARCASAPITVALVDDEQLIRAALAHALSTAGIEVVGEAESGRSRDRPCSGRAARRRPDGSAIRGAVGRRCDRAATTARPRLTRAGADPQRAQPRRRGDHRRRFGYILKTAPAETIVGAVKATAAGGSVLSSEIAGKLLQRIRELDIPVRRTRAQRWRSGRP